jgi:hypothetical protein
MTFDRAMKWYFECKICGYDSDEAKLLSDTDDGLCPLCLSDCGHHHPMRFRPATDEEIAKHAQTTTRTDG